MYREEESGTMEIQHTMYIADKHVRYSINPWLNLKEKSKF